ncbi:ABC transporter substrate-binding protein [Sneathiella sp.]|uniref:ABC transporter substrate-binding protein n=1 Tax=Sneathiella sp. TaxID=1964365 RepID=UPI003569E6C0
MKLLKTTKRIAALGLSVLMAASIAQAGSLPKEVKIGGLMPLTGNAGFVGVELRKGLDLALAEYHKNLPEGLPSIDVIYVDSQADPRMGFQGYQRLVTRDEVKVIVLTYTSVAKAAAPQAIRDKTGMMNVTQGPVTELGKNFTSTLPPYSMQGLAVLKYAVSKLGLKRIAVIYENSEAFVAAMENLRDVACPQVGCEVVASEEIPAGATDIAAQVTAALATNPDAVFPIGIQAQTIPVVRELHTRDYKGQIIGNGELGAIISAGSGNLIEGAIYPTYAYEKDNPDFIRVSKAVMDATGKEATQYLFLGYQAGQVVAGVMAQMDKMGLEWSGDNFIKAQIAGKFSTIMGEVSFLEDGRIVEPMTMMEVKDGKGVAVGKVLPEDLIEK